MTFASFLFREQTDECKSDKEHKKNFNFGGPSGSASAAAHLMGTETKKCI